MHTYKLLIEIETLVDIQYQNVTFILFRISSITDDYEKIGLPNNLVVVEKMESSRIIKTHLSWDMIPSQIAEKNAKVK